MPTLSKLVYSPHENPTTFVLMVDEEAYRKHKKDKSVPIAEVVDDFRIFKQNSGLLEQPSKREIEEVFGTTDEYKVCEIMLEKGRPHGHKMLE